MNIIVKEYARRWGWLVDSGLRAAYFREQGDEENINLQAIQNGKKSIWKRQMSVDLKLNNHTDGVLS